MSKFDPDMTYWQSFKIVAREIVLRWPIDRDAVDGICEGACQIVDSVLVIAFRVLVLAFAPLSIPLLALAVQADRRKTAKQMEMAKRRVAEQQNRLVQVANGKEVG
jgi:hypothetical protein